MSKENEQAPLHSTATLVRDLARIGVKPGTDLIVHSSYKAIGRVIGGPAAVILALEEAVTETGTLVMPTFTESLCDPAEEENYHVENEREFVRENIPLYRADLTPTDKWNGIIPEVFRKQDGTLRSSHPHLSFAARGPNAAAITDNHSFYYALGEGSPIGKLYGFGGYVLLLGAPKDSNASIHLAEYRQPEASKKPKNWDARMLVDGEPKWVQYKDIVNKSEDFPQVLDAFIEAGGPCREGKIGGADSFFVNMPELVDFAVGWIAENRR